jgi:hypothetical protein
MKILYKFASRSRPEKFFKCIDNINALSTHDNYLILASIDTDDITMNNKDVVIRMNATENLKYIFGRSLSKINAINRDMYTEDDWDILINMSDDMLFVKQGFDTQIVEDFQKHFPDMDGVLHYSDGNKACNSLMTMSIMTRKYYDRFGYIYNPEYISLWCDNEATDVAKMLNRYRYMGDNNILFNHNHPAHKPGFKVDEQLKHSESFFNEDKATYMRRKSNRFGIPLSN